jgi:cephalosporin hydroxylase
MLSSIRKLRHGLNNLTIQTGNLSRMEALDRSTRIVIPVPVDESCFKNTRLHWSRESACKNLNIDPKYILEIGTLAGDFADFLIKLFSPEITVLVDYFEASDYVFGVQRFTPQTHLDFVKQRFKDQPSVELLKGESSIVLEKMLKSKRKFDFIYIDAGHTYNDVSRDLELAHQLLNPNGIIGMNDYIMTDYYYDTVYGVVQATNSFLKSHPNYTVEAFAFNNNLFSDIYLRNN